VGLWDKTINPLNAELNPICHLLILLGAHHILHVSRIRVKQGSATQTCVNYGWDTSGDRGSVECRETESLMLNV
jgi:hypothetical protein